MTNYQTKRNDEAQKHANKYYRDDGSLDEKQEFAAEQFEYGFDSGFQYAIDLLRTVEEATNGGITNCIHSNEWAKFLDSKLEPEAKND